MNKRDHIDRICLRVVAKVSATVSHEIKNTLSIINENAGLLEDLAGLADQETGMEPRRVEKAASIIMRQVARSNTIMKNLNMFAHSGDTPTAQSNIDEILSLMIALTARQAAMKKIVVEVGCEAGLAIQSNLLWLESLLYLTLCRLYNMADSGSVIRLEATAASPNILVHFAVEGGAGILPAEYPDAEEGALAERLGASCLLEKNGLSVILPISRSSL